MAKEKEIKTNAMRILDRQKIKYEVLQYECDEFIDGLHTAEKTGAPVEQSFKTLVAQGKSKQYYVLVLPIAEEVDLKKAAKAVGEKSIEIADGRVFAAFCQGEQKRARCIEGAKHLLGKKGRFFGRCGDDGKIHADHHQGVGKNRQGEI